MVARVAKVWNGTAWEDIGPQVSVAPIAYVPTAPTTPATGDVWIDSDSDVPTVDPYNLVYQDDYGNAAVNGTVTSAAGVLDQSMQFAAAGSLLNNLPARVHPAENILKQAVWWIDAAHFSAGNQTIQNLGWGGNALNARAGSTTSADSNDPKFLDWDGENYVYLPGSASNYLSIPDAANLDITGDIDIIIKVALDDFTPATTQRLLSKWTSSGGNSLIVTINTTGILSLQWTPDGVTSSVKSSTVVVPANDGTTLWVRATLDVDNGASGHDVKFYTSIDGATWTQLGSTVTTSGTTNIFVSASDIEIGSRSGGSTENTSAKIYRAIIKNGIDGTTVLDVDTSMITSGSATSFTARTGQVVTINRSTSGRKTVAVTHPCWLFGTDDYMEVADNDLLDFGSNDSFSIVAVRRQWSNSTDGNIITKRTTPYSTATEIGYAIADLSTQVVARISDGTNVTAPINTTVIGTIGVLAFVRNKTSLTAELNLNGQYSSFTDNSGNLSNSLSLHIGKNAGGTPRYGNMEFVSAAIFRRALTATEIQLITNYFQGRAT